MAEKNTSWHFGKDIVERNEYMLDNELATDVVFQVSATGARDDVICIKAHRYMLIAASPVFLAMFCGQMQETDDVIVQDVEPEAFKQMLRYIYTEKETFSGDTVMHVLYAAKKYQLHNLAAKCTQFLDQQLDAQNACTLLEHSRFFKEEALATKCMDVIEQQTNDAFASDGFLDVSQATLSAIVEREKLFIKEIDVFKRCIEWAKKQRKDKNVGGQCDGTNIRETLDDALFKIRFPIMSAAEFTDVVCPENVLTDREQVMVFRHLNTANKSDSTVDMPFSVKRRISKDCIEVGDRVRVKRSVATPRYNWGNVSHGQVGVVKSIHGDKIYVDFVNNNSWQGHMPEMELAHI